MADRFQVAKGVLALDGAPVSTEEKDFIELDGNALVLAQTTGALMQRRGLESHARALREAAERSSRSADSLTKATWALVGVTLLLAVAAIFQACSMH